MSNKVKYNLKNVHAAKLTTEVVEGVTNYTYAMPKAKALPSMRTALCISAPMPTTATAVIWRLR